MSRCPGCGRPECFEDCLGMDNVRATESLEAELAATKAKLERIARSARVVVDCVTGERESDEAMLIDLRHALSSALGPDFLAAHVCVPVELVQMAIRGLKIADHSYADEVMVNLRALLTAQMPQKEGG